MAYDQNQTIRRFMRLAAIALGLGAAVPDEAGAVDDSAVRDRRNPAQSTIWRQAPLQERVRLGRAAVRPPRAGRVVKPAGTIPD